MIKESYLNKALFLGMLLFVLIAYFLDEPFYVSLITRAAIFAIAGIGLNIALGYGGLISLGHAVFFGLGGYSMGILASHAQVYMPIYEGFITINGSQSMVVAWLLAMFVSGLAAFLIGLVSLRTSGIYFIMITLAFGQMFYFFSISWSAYGGEDGLLLYSRNHFPGLDTLNYYHFFIIVYALLGLLLYFSHRLNHSPFGLVLNAARQTPIRVQTSGIKTMNVRLIAFVISGMITGLAGALFADLNKFVSPTMFSWQTSGEIMVFVILGGVARLYGPVLGACVFILLEVFLGEISHFWHLYLGLLLLAIVLFANGGLIGLLTKKEGDDANHG